MTLSTAPWMEPTGTKIENPCVGGSIPPQATKVYLAKTPTHVVGVFVSGDKQSSCPVHFRAVAFFGKLSPTSPPADDFLQRPC